MSESPRIIHHELGFLDRYHYFETLSVQFSVPIMKIILKAEELGIEQDFDELLYWVMDLANAFQQTDIKKDQQHDFNAD